MEQDFNFNCDKIEKPIVTFTVYDATMDYMLHNSHTLKWHVPQEDNYSCG